MNPTTDPEAWNELIRAVPWGCVMIVMFYGFLSFLRKKDAAQLVATTEANAQSQMRLMAAAETCHATTDRATDALFRHAETSSAATTAMMAQTTAIASQTAMLQTFAMAVEGCAGIDGRPAPPPASAPTENK